MNGNRDGRFLIIHHRSRYGGFYDVILDWISANLPEHRFRFDLRALPCRLPCDGAHSLMIPWLQDPVQQWSQRAYRQAMELTTECDRKGVPVVNRVERLARAGKFDGARFMRDAGLRTPRVAIIQDRRQFLENIPGLSFPILVRENLGHGGRMLRADTFEEARKIPLRQFKAPVAVELIDLPDPRDGLYRKYRYVVAGDFGVPHHIQTSAEWITRGGNRVINEITKAEELAYIETACPHHEAFQHARKALGLDFIAFDYSLDRDGFPIVWEANPYPTLHFSRRELKYRNEAMHRTIAIVVAMYFQQASLAVPDRLYQYLRRNKAILPGGFSAVESSFAAGYWEEPVRSGKKERSRAGRITDKVRDFFRSLKRSNAS